MANLEIAGAHKRTQKGNVDYYYGGENEAWADLASAKAGVPSSIRPGKTVGVYISGEIVEYWWPDATHIADSDLIVKEVPLPQALGTTDSPTFDNLNIGGTIITEGVSASVVDTNDLSVSATIQFPAGSGLGTLQSAPLGPGGAVWNLPAAGGDLATTANISAAVAAGNHYRGKYATLTALQATISTGIDGDYAIVTGSPNDQEYIWDSDHSSWTLTANIPAGTFAGLGGSPTDNGALASALAAKVDKVTGYDLISSSDQTKLNGIASGATANSAAAQSDVTTGTDNVKYLTSSLWTWIKTQVQTIAGIWNFSNGLQVGGNNVETQNNKDAGSGYVGLTSFKINFKNAANTFTSFFTNANTANRTYTFKDRNGTILDDTDAATFVDLSSNQTVAGNKTLTGVTTVGATSPVLQLQTSADSKIATLTRSTTNNTLTLTNNVQQAGGAGGCLNFLAANTQTVTVPTTGLSTSEFNFTVSIIFKTTQTHGGLLYIQSSTGSGYRTGVEINGSSINFTNNGGSGDQVSVTVNDGLWHLVVLDYGVGGTVHLYVDNILKATSTSTLSTGRIIPNAITIGNSNLTGSGLFPFTGSIAQFCMWTSILGSTDRNSLWSGGSFTSTPPTASSTLARDYEFQDGSGGSAHDNSSSAVNGTLINSPIWMGPGNGIIAQSATATSSTFLRVIDGVNANERGQVFVSDTLAGTRIQGYTIKYFINNGIPFLVDNVGQVLISPSNTSETVRSQSALGVAGGVVIGSIYSIGNAAPTDGLLVQGKTGLGVITTNSMLEVGGTVSGVSGTGIGLKSAPLIRATANNDYLIGADFTGATYDINTNGTAIQSCTITNAGNGYVSGIYSCSFSNITGSGAGGQAVITVAGGVVTNINTSFPDGTGSGYAVGNQLTITNVQLGGSGSGFVATVSVTRVTGVTTVNLRANTFAPATNGTGTVGTSGFYYNTFYGNTLSALNVQAKVTTLTFQGADGYVGAVMNTNSTGGNWTFNGTTVNAGWRVDVGAGTSGSLRANGTITATANLAQGVYFNNTLSPSANNDVLVGVDINPTISLLPTKITSLGAKTAGSGYTNGTYTAQALTGGTGSGATATIVVASGIISTVTLVSGGTGYTAGDTLSASIPAGSGFSIPVATVGYTGVTSLSLRTSGDIQLGGKLSIPTGSNKSAGTATLVSGTVTISNTLVTANSIIMLSYRNPSGTTGTHLAQGTIVAGTSFVVNSLDTSSSVVTADNNTFNWWIIN